MSHLERSVNLLSLLTEAINPTGSNSPDPLIESVVVNYLLTTTYADLEIGVRAILKEYGERSISEDRVLTYFDAASKKIVRSIKCTELAGVLKMFDIACQRHFQDSINGTPEQLAYDRIVAGRHDQTHNLGSEITLEEFSADIASCDAILAKFENALRCTCHS